MTKDDVSWLAELADYANNDCNDPSWLISFANLVSAHEREECAKVCDLESVKWKSPKYNFATASAKHCAEAIRARGNQ